MSIILKYHSNKYAKNIIETKIGLFESINKSILRATSTLTDLTRPNLNDRIESYLVMDNWSNLLKEEKDIDVEFVKNNTGLKIRTGHPSFIGLDLLEFELARQKNYIDCSVYIVVTSKFKKKMIDDYHIKWEGSLSYEKAIKEIERLNSLIHTPILLIGIDFE